MAQPFSALAIGLICPSHKIRGAISMTAQSYDAKSNTNGNPEHTAETSSATPGAAAASGSREIMEELQALQHDVAHLSEQWADLVTAKGKGAWVLAKDNIDDMLAGAGAKGKEAADAVGDMRDSLAAAIDDSVKKRPYMTLALTVAAGFVVGAMWKR
jgi:ElaB/YqjD/DUF883 family membrane-anchored ribosome-binding protein